MYLDDIAVVANTVKDASSIGRYNGRDTRISQRSKTAKEQCSGGFQRSGQGYEQTEGQ